MAVSAQHSSWIDMAQLISHCIDGRAGLNQLAGVGVPQAVEGELIRQTSFANGCLEQVLVIAEPRLAAIANKHKVLAFPTSDKVQEPRHAFVRQEHETRAVLEEYRHHSRHAPHPRSAC